MKAIKNLQKHCLSILFFSLATGICFGQSSFEWSEDYSISLEDFQSSQTEIDENVGISSIFSGASMDFRYQMTNGQFMFTKNFNSYVTTYWNRESAIIVATDSTSAQQLVEVGQYYFDITELYSRKFRKRLYEEKGAFSNPNFFQSIHQDLQNEMNEEVAQVWKTTELGQNKELLEEEHQKVLDQILELSDFCKECKTPKKKKKKNK